MKTPFTDAFLEDLKTKMQQLRLKRTTLARDIGTTKQAVNRWYHGTMPSGEYILKIQDWQKKNKITMFL